MILYGSSFSPYVRKVLAFAAEKGIELKLKPLGLGSTDPEFLAASPFAKIPALRDGDFTLADSSAIVAYLDAMAPEPDLVPMEPRARARTVWFDEFADTILFPAIVPIFFNRIVSPRFLKQKGDEGAAERAERDALPPVLDYLEGVIPQSLHLVEDRLTQADIAVASVLANLDHVGLLDDPRHPRIAAFARRMHERPSFARSLEVERRALAR